MEYSQNNLFTRDVNSREGVFDFGNVLQEYSVMLAKDTQLGQFEDRFAKSEIGQDLACSHCLTPRQGQGFPPCRAKYAENRIWAAAKTLACRTQSSSKVKSLQEIFRMLS